MPAPLSPTEATKLYLEALKPEVDAQIERINTRLSTSPGEVTLEVPHAVLRVIQETYREAGWVVETYNDRNGNYLTFKRDASAVRNRSLI
jgi:hypothetical protein